MGMRSFVLRRSGFKGISYGRSILENWLNVSANASSSLNSSPFSDSQQRTFHVWKGGSRTHLQSLAGSFLPMILIKELQVAPATTESDACYNEVTDACKQAVAQALQASLQKTGKLDPSEATIVVNNAPSSVKAFASRATEMQASEPDRCKWVETMLEANESHVLELLLESIGVPPERLESLAQSQQGNAQALLFIIRTFERLGISRSDIGGMVEQEPKVLQYTDDEIQAGIQTLKKLQVSEEEMVEAIQKYPLVFSPDVMNNIKLLLEELSVFPSKDVIIRKAVCKNPLRVSTFSPNGARAAVQYLQSFGLSVTRLNVILQRHFRLVLSDVNKELKGHVQFLKDLGIPEENVIKVITKCPGFFFYSLQNGLIAKREYFKSLGIDDSNFAKMVTRLPSIFSFSLENKIKPAVEELRSLGLSPESLRKAIRCKPSLFAYKLGGDISKLIENLNQSNVSERKKVTTFIKLASRRSDHMQNCEDCLVQHGLSCDEAKRILEKEPRILGHSKEALSLKIENLTLRLGVPIKSIVKVPEYLSSDLRKRIFRRQRVLAYLKSKGLLRDMLTLKQMLMPSNKQFCDLYVKSHPEDTEISKIWFESKSGMDKFECFDFIKKWTDDSSEDKTSS